MFLACDSFQQTKTLYYIGVKYTVVNAKSDKPKTKQSSTGTKSEISLFLVELS